MTTRTVIAALGLAILLGGIAWLIVGGKGGTPAAALGSGDLIVDIDAFSARFVRVTHPDGRVEEARRDGINAPWLLTIGGSERGVGGGQAWVLQPTRMTHFLRVVQNTATRAVPEAGSTIGKDPIVLELPAKAAEGAQAEPGVVRIRFGGKRLGGNSLVEVSDPSRGAGEPYLAVISDDVLRAISEPGLSAWRETAIMPEASQLASRLTLSRPDASFTLGRINGRWRITAPFGAPADEAKIPGILRALESVRIAEFLDFRQPTDAEAGLDEPMAIVTLESQRPDGPVTRTLAIGSPVPGQSGQAFARVGDSTHIVRIDATPLTTLPGSALALVNPAATPVPVTEIFNIALRRLDASGPDMVFRKELERWGEVTTSEELLVLDDAGASQIGELLQFLTTVKPEHVTASPPEAFMPLGTITLGSMGASPLEELTIGVLPTDSSVSIVLTSRAPGVASAEGNGSEAAAGLHRVYAEGRTPLIIRHFLSGQGGGFEPITAPEQSSDPTAK